MISASDPCELFAEVLIMADFPPDVETFALNNVQLKLDPAGAVGVEIVKYLTDEEYGAGNEETDKIFSPNNEKQFRS